MRNRLAPAYDSSPALHDRGDDVDAEPGLRLLWLAVAMTLPLLVVAGRLIHLQGFRAEAFAVEEQAEQITAEEIPARHGRILSADGQLLAYDEERHRILVHFRWLEEPPNEQWLRGEALSRLSRADRRDKRKVSQAEAEVLARRDELWRSLAELTEVSNDKLTTSRRRIQDRVERILRSVEERANAANSRDVGNSANVDDSLRESNAAPASSDSVAAATRNASGNAKACDSRSESATLSQPTRLLSQVWDVVKHELTTSPTRDRSEPIRIPEQTEHHVLLDDVDWQVVAAIETNPARYPGVRADVISRRVYPRGDLAPHVIGYRTPIRDDQLAKRNRDFPNGDPLDYRPGDLIGQAGVELSYESVLRGVRGQRRVIRDRHGAVVRTELIRAARPGRDVVLNLKVPLQEQVNSVLSEVLAGDETGEFVPQGACIVALDVRSGAVLAAASAPSFDLNEWLGGSATRRQELIDDPRHPLLSRATQGALPPGSVFKTVSAVAAIESGKIDPDRGIECRGYLDQPNKHRCYLFTHFGHGHGATDLSKALAMSCNVYFFQAARTIGPQVLCAWADRLGFGHPTGVDLPAEQSGRLPRPPDGNSGTLAANKKPTSGRVQPVSHEEADDASPIWNGPVSPWADVDSPSADSRNASRREPWYPGDTLGLAIGQSRLTTTPLQIGRLMAAIANGGWLVTPHVASEISPAPEVRSPSDADQTMERIAFQQPQSQARVIEPQRQRVTISDSTLALVREGLEQVVAHPQGTGYKTVRLKDISIAGKTGTAEIGPDKTGRKRPDHAWFAGYVPANDPQIAFVVVLEQAGSGGKAAGPVARRFVESLLELGIVPASKR